MCSLRLAHDSGGRPYARFRRALEVRSVMQAEWAAREMGRLGLVDALDYLALLSQEAPDRYDRAARSGLAGSLAESRGADAGRGDGGAGLPPRARAGYGEQSREVLRALVKRRHGTRGQ